MSETIIATTLSVIGTVLSAVVAKIIATKYSAQKGLRDSYRKIELHSDEIEKRLHDVETRYVNDIDFMKHVHANELQLQKLGNLVPEDLDSNIVLILNRLKTIGEQIEEIEKIQDKYNEKIIELKLIAGERNEETK